MSRPPAHVFTVVVVCVAMTAYATTQDDTAVDRPNALQARFEQLWNASGAVPLSGYEKVFVAMLAAAERPLYAQLLSVDFADPASVEAGADAIRQWRRKVVGVRPITGAVSVSPSASSAGRDLRATA
jgi:hypothetical protein